MFQFYEKHKQDICLSLLGASFVLNLSAYLLLAENEEPEEITPVLSFLGALMVLCSSLLITREFFALVIAQREYQLIPLALLPLAFSGLSLMTIERIINMEDMATLETDIVMMALLGILPTIYLCAKAVHHSMLALEHVYSKILKNALVTFSTVRHPYTPLHPIHSAEGEPPPILRIQ